MRQRQLIIEQASRYRKRLPFQVHVHVDDQTPIRPWVTTLAVHLHYPLVDSFGAPITYRLQCISRKDLLLTSGRFANVEFPSGSHFVLEPETYHTEEMPAAALDQHHSTPQADSSLRLSRRGIIRSCMLAGVSLFGLGSGVTTAFAQHLLTQKASTTSPPSTHKQTTPLPSGISVQTIFSQHQQTVRALTWSPDEQMLASGGNDHLALVWQLDGTRLYTHTFDAHVRALAWSPDGLQFVAEASTTVTFFDAHTGARLTRDTEHHTDVVTALGWVQGPSGLLHVVSAGADKRAIVWNGQSHQPEVTFRRHTTAIEALTTLQETVMTASQGGVARVWNATSGQEIHGYYFDTQQTLRAVTFSSGGTLATGSDDGLIHLWSDGRTCIRQVQGAFGMHCVDTPIRLQKHTRPVRALAFSPDGTLLASGGDDKNLIIWSIPEKAPLLIQKQQEGLTALAWSPSGQLLAGAVGTRVMLWRIHQ